MIGIIGATSQIGKELVKSLTNAHKDFVAFARERTRAEAILGTVTHFREFDFCNPISFAPAFTGISSLFLVVDKGENLERTLSDAKNAGVNFVVFISGMGAEQRPSGTLRQAELVLLRSGLRFVVLRANWFMQNFLTHFINDIKQGSLRFPTLDAKISFVDARDIADACCKLLTTPAVTNNFFTMTGPQAFSHTEVAALIQTISGARVSYESISDQEAKAHFGWNDEVLALFEDIRLGRCALISSDLEEILQRPRRTLPDFIAENQNAWI